VSPDQDRAVLLWVITVCRHQLTCLALESLLSASAGSSDRMTAQQTAPAPKTSAPTTSRKLPCVISASWVFHIDIIINPDASNAAPMMEVIREAMACSNISQEHLSLLFEIEAARSDRK
jgi:hypothetical protein